MEMNKKKKIIYMTLILLMAMFLCTLISRSVYAAKLPQITAEEPQKRSISHTVEAAGVVRQSREYAVSVLGGLKVETVYVGIGDEIAADTLLFTIDKLDLEKQIAVQELEIRKLKEQLKVMKMNRNLEQSKSLIEQKRAEADSQSIRQKNDSLIEQEAQKENQAAAELKKHLEQKPAVTSKEEREKRLREYESWQSEGTALEENVERYRSDLNQAQEEVRIAQEAYDKLASAGKNQQVMSVSGNNLDGWKQVLEEAIARRDELKSFLDNALKALQQHKEDAVAKPDFIQEDDLLSKWNETKSSLEGAVNSAVKAKNDAAMIKQEEELAAGRKMEDAAFPQNADSAIAVSEMELAYKQQVLEEYRNLMKTGGQVMGKEEGVITSIKVSAGENTPAGAGIVYADKKENLQFTAQLTTEQKKYVDQGMSVSLTFAGRNPVDAFADYIGEGNNGYEVLVTLPDGAAGMGQCGTMSTVLNSVSFSQCIPISALHPEKERYFIYVVREQEGILGKELAAEKRYVTVKDKNDRYGALEDGTLAEGEKVIVTTTRELADGEPVKYRLAK